MVILEPANPPQGGDAKSWIPPARDRQTAEGPHLWQFLFIFSRYKLSFFFFGFYL
jgi:hypothetical protein